METIDVYVSLTCTQRLCSGKNQLSNVYLLTNSKALGSDTLRRKWYMRKACEGIK